MEDKMRRSFFSTLFAICLISFAAAACSFLPTKSPGLTNGPDTTVPPQITEESASIPPAEEVASTAIPVDSSITVIVPDPLNNLLELHSVKITLAALRPDGTSRSIQVEIDDVGNMHLQYTLPAINISDLPENLDFSEVQTGYEIFMIDGKAFSPSESDQSWLTNPVNTDFAPVLSSQFHSLEGFTTWLDMLPAGSLQATAGETVGGFSTDKYLINGTIGGQQITGALWYDQPTHSLVKAELHIPGVLDSSPENPETGEILITLTAEKTQIPLVSLPPN
jgi:hypothetical protein